jgi:hypothetical protein
LLFTIGTIKAVRRNRTPTPESVDDSLHRLLAVD